MTSRIRVRLLGPVGATVDGAEADIAGPKERAVLALLAATPASTNSADRLINALWGNDAPKSAKKTLQTYISRLRQATDMQAIVTSPGGYALSSVVTTDVEEVDALMASARQPTVDRPGRVELLRDALGRFTGSPLAATAPTTVLDALAESYDQLRWNLVEELAAARLEIGDDPSLTVDLHAWVDENSHRERLWGHLMTALYRAGRQAEALAAFRRARQHLTEGLGVDPGPELRDLESRILQHDPSLLRPTSEPMASQRPPTRTLTFLFTDIEQSTVRWDLEPEPMGRAIQLHDEIINATAERTGGHVFSTAGDGFGIAFADPADAASAALDLQRRLADSYWPTSEPLRVRMGLHTGTAENRGGDYFGSPVNRAARVTDAAHGGQILCSAATAALLSDDSDHGPHLDFVAECRLKGLERPERLHQLGASGSAGFPAPRSAPAAARTVPASLDSLHGRDRELAELIDIVTGQRLVTLTGVGGTGKTRLALEFAQRIAEAYPDGVIWIELADIDTSGVVGAAATALGIALTGTGDGHRGQVATALRNERALLVLDNCEHLLGAAADNVEAILRTCPDITILTTSREPLGVAGERVYVVPSLELPPERPSLVDGISASEQLVRARAETAGAVIGDDDATVDAIRELCRRVDGVPLALEFAAAQLATFPAPQLVRLLHEHFELLGRPGRGVARQQTIDSTIEWSYRALDDTERCVVDRLAVFHGGFDLDAVEAVAAFDLPPGTSHVTIDRLHRKSVVTVTTDPGSAVTRFKLLEPVRQFVHTQLRLGDDHDAVLQRHAQHFLATVERPTWGDRIDGEQDRVEAVLRDLANHRQALRTLTARDDPTDALRLFDAHLLAYTIAWSDATNSASTFAELLSDPDLDVDPIIEGNACNAIAMIQGLNGEASALDWAGRALQLAESTGHQTLTAETNFHLGTLATTFIDLPCAERHLRQSCALHEELENWATLSYNLCWLAWVLAARGKLDEAVGPARRGTELTWRHRSFAGSSAAVAAAVLAVAGHHDEAAAILEQTDSGSAGAFATTTVAGMYAGRPDLAARAACAHIELGLADRNRSISGFSKVIAALCDDLGEHDLSALWAADDAALVRRFGEGSDELVDIASVVDRARVHIGDRFDELVRHYETTNESPPIRETYSVLYSHAGRTASAGH